MFIDSSIFKKKKILLFPVETIVRELDYRLILAVLCSRPDWQIIFGHHVQLVRVARNIKNALIILKDTFGNLYDIYKKNNIRVIHLDEEGAIYRGDKRNWENVLLDRLDVKKLRSTDFVCTWGGFQQTYYRSFDPACYDNIVVTGSPRFQLGRPSYSSMYSKEVKIIKEQYGRIILINTNFISNNCAGPDFNLKYHGVENKSQEIRNYYLEEYVYIAKIEASYIDLINRLSNRFLSHTIVLRPHPSENMHTYETFFKYIPRAVVTREGSLNSWLQASDVLIHNGCTTAVEGYQSGTPIVNYAPISDERFDIVLPNLLGSTCRTAVEVLTTLESIFAKGYVPKTNDQNMLPVEEMIANFNTKIDAFTNLQCIISKCQDEAQNTEILGKFDPVIIRKILEYKLFPTFIWKSIKNIKDFIKPKSYKGSNKFPDFNEAEILAKIKIIEEITGKKVKVKFHSHSILSITGI
jgi:surface carbohydrate biosynthesis protein